MKIIKNKSIKWWVGVGLCLFLFLIILVFAYIKMNFVMMGVQIEAEMIYEEENSLAEVKGKSPRATHLSLNGREIYIDKNGFFSEQISLFPGFNVINLEAKDKFGKTAEKKFEIYYNI